MNVDFCSNPLCVPVLLPQSILPKYFSRTLSPSLPEKKEKKGCHESDFHFLSRRDVSQEVI